MLINVLIAVLLITINIFIHAAAMMLIMRLLVQNFTVKLDRILWSWPVFPVCLAMLLMFLASICEVMVWAIAYLTVHAVQGFEKAVYFSMVTFTSLGYGDIVLSERWRLLASFEAACGIIMFGWTTALVIAVVQRVYFNIQLVPDNKKIFKEKS